MPDLLISNPDADIIDAIRGLALGLGCTVREPAPEPSVLALAQALAPGLTWESESAYYAQAPIAEGWITIALGRRASGPEIRVTVHPGLSGYRWPDEIPSATHPDAIASLRDCLISDCRRFLRDRARERHPWMLARIAGARALLAGLGEGA